MAIDATVPLSPGWWVQRLAAKMLRRQKQLNRLDAYMRGEPPVDLQVDAARVFYRNFMRKARSNFAELVIEAVRERMSIQGFRTATDGDDEGDETAWAIWKENGLGLESADVHEQQLALGIAYAIVGYNAETKRPVITGEDPRQVITEHDPANPQKVIAALKLFHDDVNHIDVAYLYLPGKVYIATRQRKAQARPDGSTPAPLNFTPASYEWVDSELVTIEGIAAGLSSDEFDALVATPLPDGAADIVPVVPFRNKHELGDFETHIDLLDRINHTILQRMVIATFQAFRQRAVKGTFPDTNEDGEPIDYDAIFSADPGALWRMPADAEFWESAQLDLGPILNSVKDDVEHLAAVTRTPIHYLTPGQTAQSAEGASLAREGLVFKTEDRIARADVGWTQVMRLAYLYLGDAERSDLSKLQPIWGPVERYSLAEKAAASVQAVTVLPWETILETIWQLTGAALTRAKSQRSTDMVTAQVALMKAAAEGKAQPPVIEDQPSAA